MIFHCVCQVLEISKRSTSKFSTCLLPFNWPDLVLIHSIWANHLSAPAGLLWQHMHIKRDCTLRWKDNPLSITANIQRRQVLICRDSSCADILFEEIVWDLLAYYTGENIPYALFLNIASLNTLELLGNSVDWGKNDWSTEILLTLVWVDGKRCVGGISIEMALTLIHW